MKKLYRNITITIIAGLFLAAFIAGDASAQTKTSAKATPKTVKSPTSAAKAAPNPIAAGQQIIVTAIAPRVRALPKPNSAEVSVVKLGKTLPVIEKTAAWYRVEYAKGKNGWISKTLVKDYENAARDQIYREIAGKYSPSKNLDFAAASEVADFLRTAQASVFKADLKADLSFKRLRVLAAALKAIPSGKGGQFPYKTFLASNEKDVTYSEPSGEWYIRSELFWELHGKYKELPIAEEIAWEAAQNPIPGECEGDVICYLYLFRATDGEYLNFYPNGKHSRKALANMTDLLEPMVADLKNASVYSPPLDISDRAEFNRFLTELRAIISKMTDAGKASALRQITQLGEEYK